jgi:hypothetical protein
MKRVHQFIVATDVPIDASYFPDIQEMVRVNLDEASREPMVGPRGGRYERIGPLYYGPDGEIIVVGEWVGKRFWAKFHAKYVRPKR